MVEVIRWLSANTGAAWVLVIAAGTALAVWSEFQKRGRQKRDSGFGREVFARTRDIEGYGLLREPRDGDGW